MRYNDYSRRTFPHISAAPQYSDARKDDVYEYDEYDEYEYDEWHGVDSEEDDDVAYEKRIDGAGEVCVDEQFSRQYRYHDTRPYNDKTQATSSIFHFTLMSIFFIKILVGVVIYVMFGFYGVGVYASVLTLWYLSRLY